MGHLGEGLLPSKVYERLATHADVFIKEHKTHSLRRWKATAHGLEFFKDEQGGLSIHHEPCEADRIQLISLLLTKDEERGGCGLGNLEHLDEDDDHDPRILAVFPLHNPEFVKSITDVRASAARALDKLLCTTVCSSDVLPCMPGMEEERILL